MTMKLEQYMLELASQARASATEMAKSSTAARNQALLYIAEQIQQHRSALLDANQKDLQEARKKQLDAPLIDRLELTAARIDAMLVGLKQVADLSDPIGSMSDFSFRPTGIQVGKMRVPLGVVGIIYESRPNVTIEAASLCIKSANACILRGGSESIHSNQALASCIATGLKQAGLPATAVQVVNTSERELVGKMISMPNCLDVIIPRGGKGLIERISAEAKVPVIKHLDGICHVYLDEFADPEKAFNIAINAKTQRYGTCNTMETLLVHAKVGAQLLPKLQAAYTDLGVELRGCEQTKAILSNIQQASEEDWQTEYLAPILAIKIVADLDSAIAHINQYSSAHTDSIVSENYSHTQRFIREVDSSSVMINASTRFADGFEYGLGAEIGISTDKFHARGPVGLEGLTSQKYVVFGHGEIRT